MDPELAAKARTLLTQASDIGAKAEAENRDLTDGERAEVTRLLNEATGVKNMAKVKSTLIDIDAITGERPGLKADGRSVGTRFVESDEWAGFQKSNPSGFEGKNRITSQPVRYAGIKALVTGLDDTSAGALVAADNVGLVDQGIYARPLTVLELINRGVTGSDVVEYVRETAAVNNAASVPEATQTAHTGDETATKPESSLTLAKATANVVTIAHWIPATKRALSDAAQVRSLIDAFLRYGLLEALEDQIVSGAGGDDFVGILNAPGHQVQAWDTDMLVTARKARTKVRTVGRAAANAYLLHPNDAERIDLLRDTTGQFYFGGPVAGGPQVLWRLPVVESEAVPEGTGIVGDFRRAMLWDREQAAISVSDSHNDFFIRNLVAILAELRAAFAVIRPAAFVEFDLTAGS